MSVEKRELWLKDKTREYVHGWRQCEKGNSYNEFMYPEQPEQDQYAIGWREYFAVDKCGVGV